MKFEPIKNSLYFLRQGMRIGPFYNFEMSSKQIAIVITCKVLSYCGYAVLSYYICKWIFE